MTEKLLVMTAEKVEELRKAGAYAEEVIAAMTEIDLDDIPVVAHGPILHRIEARIKEGTEND